jgi:hypothetical protein
LLLSLNLSLLIQLWERELPFKDEASSLDRRYSMWYPVEVTIKGVPYFDE